MQPCDATLTIVRPRDTRAGEFTALDAIRDCDRVEIPLDFASRRSSLGSLRADESGISRQHFRQDDWPPELSLDDA
mgnify:CR=1 FL=1